jgi:hypothetical protein
MVTLSTRTDRIKGAGEKSKCFWQRTVRFQWLAFINHPQGEEDMPNTKDESVVIHGLMAPWKPLSPVRDRGTTLCHPNNIHVYFLFYK